jgi:hypothetical protein
MFIFSPFVLSAGVALPEEKKPPKNALITLEIRRMWFPIRRAWSMNTTAFSNSVSQVGDKQAEKLYDIVKLALYRSYGEILQKYPELKAIIFSEDDRLCMYQIYEILSWRLGKKEPEPNDVRLVEKLRGGIGRASPYIEL